MVTLKTDYVNGDIFYADDTADAGISGTNIENTQTNLNTTMLGTNGGIGVVSGCEVRQRAAGANMSVDVQAGTVIIGGELTTVSLTNLVIAAADAANPRIDLVMVNTSGVPSVITGTPAATPLSPAWNAGEILVGTVYVAALDTAINDTDIALTRQLFSGTTRKRFELLVDSTNQPNNSDNSSLCSLFALPAGTFTTHMEIWAQADAEGNGGGISGWVLIHLNDQNRTNTTSLTITNNPNSGSLEINSSITLCSITEDQSTGGSGRFIAMHNTSDDGVTTFVQSLNSNFNPTSNVFYVELPQNPSGSADSNLHKFVMEGW